MSDFDPGRDIGRTMRARATRALRDDILTGRLQAGARLDLDQIAEEFHTSRTPVREALLELSYEGLVAVAPRSGIVVLGITPRDAVDNFALLASLSGTAAEWATDRISAPDLAELHCLAAAIPDAPGTPVRDVVAANWAFHRALHRAAGSPRLLTFLRMAVRVVPTNFFELFPEQKHLSRSEHVDLLTAIEDHDGAAAHQIAEHHVLRAGEALSQWLRDRAQTSADA